MHARSTLLRTVCHQEFPLVCNNPVILNGFDFAWAMLRLITIVIANLENIHRSAYPSARTHNTPLDGVLGPAYLQEALTESYHHIRPLFSAKISADRKRV